MHHLEQIFINSNKEKTIKTAKIEVYLFEQEIDSNLDKNMLLKSFDKKSISAIGYVYMIGYPFMR